MNQVDPADRGADDSVWPYIGVGCLTVPIGFFGGGMIAVLVAKIVGAFSGCTPPEGEPACNWWMYLWPGALFGMIGLPTVALMRLRRGRIAQREANKTS